MGRVTFILTIAVKGETSIFFDLFFNDYLGILVFLRVPTVEFRALNHPKRDLWSSVNYASAGEKGILVDGSLYFGCLFGHLLD